MNLFLINADIICSSSWINKTYTRNFIVEVDDNDDEEVARDKLVEKYKAKDNSQMTYKVKVNYINELIR